MTTPMIETDRVRSAFAEQARWCRELGSPFTGLLCEALGTGLAGPAGDTDAGRRILGWNGNPSGRADALPLRVAGALHALVRAGSEPALAVLYPPAALPDLSTLSGACRDAFERHPAHFRDYLAVAPQTNEVGRSGVLIAGFLLFARQFDAPIHLFEIGASAGLNLIPDRYRYRFGDARWGAADARLELAPQWTGRAPPVETRFQVASRQGSDISPIDLATSRARLMSYVWPDQFDRLARLGAAIDTALRDPTPIEAAEAADWVEHRLPADDPRRDGARVLFHSVMWRYLSQATQQRIEARVAACGAAASHRRPFGWLRFELDDTGATASLLLSRWPGGDTTRVAASHPHGTSVTYLL